MINEQDIENLSKLARIELNDEEKKSLTKDIDNILGFIGEIQEAHGEVSVKSEAGVLRNVMREDGDSHEKGKHSKKLLEEAPETEEEYVKVQNIL